MDRTEIVIRCKMDGETFQKYALFDTFRRRKRWRSPAVFAAVFCMLAALCFIVQLRRGQFPILGWVLLVIGLCLPLVYLGNFYFSLRTKVKKMTKSGKTIDYIVALSQTDVTVTRKEQKQSWPWNDIFGAYRLNDMICLYPNPQQAFLLLPERNARSYEAAWELIRSQLESDKFFDLQR